jgi:hypothetical protein
MHACRPMLLSRCVRHALAQPLDGGLFRLDAAPVRVGPKFGGQFVPLLAPDAWPLRVKPRRATRDPLAFVGFHIVLSMY